MWMEDARVLCWATCDIDVMYRSEVRLLCWATCDIDVTQRSDVDRRCSMRRSMRCIATTLKRHTHGELYKTVITCHHQNPAKNICLLYFQVPRSPLASSPLIASVGIMPSCPIPVWEKFPEVQGRFNIDT